MDPIRRTVLGVAAGALMLLTAVAPAAAATTVVVTQSDQQGWSTADTRPGGTVTFVADPTSPDGGNGALRLTSDPTTTAKAQYLHGANEPLANVTELSYWNKTDGGPIHAAASYQLAVMLDGTTGFTTFVYEPYQNGVITPGAWQQWDVDAGQMWSTRTYTSGTCSVIAGGGGAPFYTLAGLQAMCPNAVVIGFGVNIGTNNPSYDVLTDLVDFNGTTYDFAYSNVPADKDACKKGGWQSLTDGQGNPFRNQGQCVSYANHG